MLGPSPLMAGDELPVNDARARILAALQPVTQQECLPLPAALGRVLAEDVISPIHVPAHDNSAMDGYAFDGQALVPGGDCLLTVVPGVTVFAGQPHTGRLAPGEALRIMTGAVMPEGLDTVVPIELVRPGPEGQILLPAGCVKPGENRRKQGEDLTLGLPALMAGKVLLPADLGLLASLGIGEVKVFRRLKVALFSTGNELRTLGQALEPGCIYDSNRFSLMSALQRLGCEVLDLGLVPDDPEALHQTVDTALAQADVVMTSGGVSMGDADYTRDILAARGEVDFWKVAMRPGRPFAFGPLHAAEGRTAWLFALPGNPVAALVTFYALAREALLRLAGAQPRPLPSLQARSVAAIRKRPGRTEYQRAVVSQDPDGQWSVQLTGAQGAGILRSMSQANALVVLHHDQGAVAAGDLVTVWLFDGLV